MALLTTIKQDSKSRIDNTKNLLSGENYLKLIKDKLIGSINPKEYGIRLQLNGKNDNELYIEWDGYNSNFITLDIQCLRKLLPSLNTINIFNKNNLLYVYFNYTNDEIIDNLVINNITKDTGKNKHYGNMVFRIMVKDNKGTSVNGPDFYLPKFSKNCKFISNNTIDIDFIEYKYPDKYSCTIYQLGESLPRLKQLKPFIELYRDHLLDNHNKYGFEDTYFEFSVNLSKFPGNMQAIKDELGIKKEQFVRY